MQRPRCTVFVVEGKRARKIASVQFQVPSITITLPARNLVFASKAIRFIEETRDKSEFRDKHLGGGCYRRMPRKLIDLSGSFSQTKVHLEKDGEFDDRYILRVSAPRSIQVTFDVSGPLLDSVLATLHEISDDHPHPNA